MKRILVLVFCAVAFQSFGQIEWIPNLTAHGIPIRLVADSVAVVDSGYVYVANRNNKYQVVTVAYNAIDRTYRLEGSKVMNRQEARSAVKRIREEVANRSKANRRYHARIKRDSAAILNLERFIVSDSTSTPGTGG